jgi:Rod binding domain-containing protein
MHIATHPSLTAARPVDPANLSLDRLTTASNLSEETKVDELSRQFESVLLRQIISEARRPVIQSGLTQPGAGSDVYQDQLNTTLADTLSRSGSVGLARSLSVQLHRQLSAPAPAPEADAQ